MFHDDDIDRDFHDSALVDKIRMLIGDDEAKAFFVHFGGLRCYIPSNAHRDDLTLLRAIARESLVKLASEFSGVYMKVPLGRSFLIQKYWEQGLGNREIAILLRITETGVEKILKRLRNQDLISRAPRPQKARSTGGSDA